MNYQDLFDTLSKYFAAHKGAEDLFKGTVGQTFYNHPVLKLPPKLRDGELFEKVRSVEGYDGAIIRLTDVLKALANRHPERQRKSASRNPSRVTTEPKPASRKAAVAIFFVAKFGKGYERHAEAIEQDGFIQGFSFDSVVETYQRHPQRTLGLHAPALTGARASSNPNHYSQNIIPILGRDREQGILRNFLRADGGFLWFQIAGSGGQGKSRLAWQLIQEAEDLEQQHFEAMWHAGFLRDDKLGAFAETCGEWVPSSPTLIVLDYVLGAETPIGTILRTLAARQNQLTQKVRVLLLERQAWNEGGLRQDLQSAKEGDFVLTASDGLADWYDRLRPADGERDLALHLFEEHGRVLKLETLQPSALVQIVKDVARHQGTDITISDEKIEQSLHKIDRDGRPLFAYFFARALDGGAYRSDWTRSDLLDLVLKTDQDRRWSVEFDDGPPDFGDNDLSMTVALLATMLRFVDLRMLRKRRFWADESENPVGQTMRRAMLLTATPRDGGAGGGSRFVRGLEPDILGEWFVLSALAKGADFDLLHKEAWGLDDSSMAQFLVRIAQDFPDHPEARALIENEPPDDRSLLEFGRAAPDVLRAVKLEKFADPSSIVAGLERAVKKEDPKAMTSLAYLLEAGRGIAKDEDRAFKLFQLASDERHHAATASLAYCYYAGIGCTPDAHEAFRLWDLAAKNKNAGAMRNLGICYENGIGVEKDAMRAVEWYDKAFKAGSIDAMVNLGICYEKGDGVEVNIETALEWYRNGAAAGDGRAMTNLGVCYQKGDGVEQSIETALDWYRKGAAVGTGGAMDNLGFCYAQGDGVEQNIEIALDWYRKGTDTGARAARSALTVLAITMNLAPPTNINPDAIPSPAIAIGDAWADTPLIDGNWQDVPDASATLSKISAAAAYEGIAELFDDRTVIGMRQIRLSCYPGFRLIDLQLKSETCDVMLANALVSEAGAILLDGTSKCLHLLNLVALETGTAMAREEYLRVFCAFVRGAEGPFQIVTSADQIPFIDHKDQSTLTAALGPLQPIDLDPSRVGQWGLRAAVLYSNALFTADFAILPNGMVEMPNDDPIATGLSILGRHYNGVLRYPLGSKTFPATEGG